jgi:hypothetical protein
MRERKLTTLDYAQARACQQDDVLRLLQRRERAQH